MSSYNAQVKKFKHKKWFPLKLACPFGKNLGVDAPPSGVQITGHTKSIYQFPDVQPRQSASASSHLSMSHSGHCVSVPTTASNWAAHSASCSKIQSANPFSKLIHYARKAQMRYIAKLKFVQKSEKRKCSTEWKPNKKPVWRDLCAVALRPGKSSISTKISRVK